MVGGFSLGGAAFFGIALYSFWFTILAVLSVAIGGGLYNLAEAHGALKQASLSVRHLVRNVSVVVAVMIPFLLVAVLIIAPLTSFALAIIVWLIANSVLNVIVLVRFFEERRSLPNN